MSTYLMRVGLGYPVKSVLDNKRVEELCRINGDLGRLGGLLKLWLTDDPHTRSSVKRPFAHCFQRSKTRRATSKRWRAKG
jgi:hypothetical protein